MKEKNWLTQLVTLFTAIASICVAIGTFYTINIINHQNKLTIRPDLLINDEKMLMIINVYSNSAYFYSSNGNIDTSCFLTYHSITDNKVTFLPTTNKFHFNLVNVGLGVAKNINFSWSFDTLKYIHRFDTIKVPILNSIEYEPKSHEIVVYGRNDTICYGDIPYEPYWHGMGTQDKFNFLLPYSNSKETISCKIPDLYLRLFALHEVVFNQLPYPACFVETCRRDFPELFLTIKYSDIGNNEFSQTFKIKVEEMLGQGGSSTFVKYMRASFSSEKAPVVVSKPTSYLGFSVMLGFILLFLFYLIKQHKP
jgi:hypothetical protein